MRLPEDMHMEILMSHRLRHVMSALDSIRVREGSAHGSTVGGSVWNAVARLLLRFVPSVRWKGDDGNKYVKADADGASSLRHCENSSCVKATLVEAFKWPSTLKFGGLA